MPAGWGCEENQVQEDWADDALWRGLVAHEPRALEALIARYSREIAYFVRIVMDGVGTAQDAEECVSDLFIAAWEEADTFDPARGSFRTWLTMRAKYLALDRRRHLVRRQAIAVPVQTAVYGGDAEATRPEDALSANAAESESLDGLLERREQQELLRRALEALPELDRLLVYLRYFHLDSTEDIAARTGLTRRAIDTRLWRARTLLRNTLQAFEQQPTKPTKPAKPAQSPAPMARPKEGGRGAS